MRLIDADEFKLENKRLLHCDFPYLSEVTLEELIDDAPTVDVTPVKHGHWIEMTVSSGSDSWKCSLCGRRARGKLKNLPYCHCGAKMDEKN